MKLPNGFGSVYKLSGKRRKPFAARKTVGWIWNEEKQKAYPDYKFIGYYATRQEALTALVEYNKNPYDLDTEAMDLETLYDRWSSVHYETVSRSNVIGCRAAWKLLEPIQSMKLRDIKLDHLQKVCDESGKNSPTLKKLKVLLGLMYDYAVMHEILTPDRRDMIRYLDVKKAGNPNALDRKPFSKQELSKLWNCCQSQKDDDRLQIPLILVYTGLRIGELLNLRSEDVHLDERWINIRHSKTKAGIREVPIAEKIVPFIRHWLQKNSEYFLCTQNGYHYLDRNFRDACWTPMMETLGMTHLPHDARHTCVSLLTAAMVDERVIRKIVGHKGQGVTETVYTHLELPIKLEAINKI